MKILHVVFFLALALSVQAERQSFERYQPIIDRQMFGAPPEGFDPTKMPDQVAKMKSQKKTEEEQKKAEEQVKKSIKFSVINVTASGETEVGFTDNGNPKMPLHYFLKVGESQNGWTVKAADAETATMTIVKDDIEVTLTLGGDSAANAAAVTRIQPGRTAGGRISGLLSAGPGSARARRQAKLEAAQAKASEEAAERAAREEREKQERAQRDAVLAEQRQQLLAIQDELKRSREAREAAEKKAETGTENKTEGE